MTSLVAHHSSLGNDVIFLQVLDQAFQAGWILSILGFTGLIRESVNLDDGEIPRSFVFVNQGLARYEDEETIEPVFFVPSVIPQFSHMRQRSSSTTSMLETECVQRILQYCTKSVAHPNMASSIVRYDVTRLQKTCKYWRKSAAHPHDIIHCTLWCHEGFAENLQHALHDVIRSKLWRHEGAAENLQVL